jgi:hypothetical protein
MKKETQEQIDSHLAQRTVSELAYLAGFVDGEGCIAIYENKTRNGYFQVRFSLQASNTDLRPLRWIASKFGGKVTRRGGKRSQDCQRREAYAWYVMNKRAATIMQLIRPYVHVKGEQIDLALQFRGTYGPWFKDPATGRSGCVPDDVRARRLVLLAEIKSLKRRAA